MTKLFRDQWQCPDCGVIHAKETLFNQWLRANDKLDSRDGLVCVDIDYVVHKFKTRYGRDGAKTRHVQCLMFVELKTFNAEASDAQQDTLFLIGQFLRNRKKTKNRDRIKRQIEGAPNKAWSRMKGGEVSVKAFGVHVLQLETNSPATGKILWDKKEITEQQLVDLFNFDLDPDSLNQLDLRVHHPKRPMTLFGERVFGS